MRLTWANLYYFYCTYDENDVGITGLHFRCLTRVLVTREVLGVDYRDYGVEFKCTARLALKLPNLKSKCRWERGAAERG